MIKGQEFHHIIDSVFDQDVVGINSSPQLKVNCPRCQERDGLLEPDGKYNLEINTEKRIFHCWKCEEPKFSGTLGRLIKLYGSVSDYKLYQSFAGEYFDYSRSEDEKEFTIIILPEEFISFKNMDTSDSKHVEAYMYMVNDRMIPKEILFKYNIGFCTHGHYKNRIIIPSYDNLGELNYFIARSFTNDKQSYDNPEINKSEIIFNEHVLNFDSTIIIVEGIFDALSLYNATPQLGKVLSDRLFFKLKEKKPYLIIILDPDAYKESVNMFQQLQLIYGNEAYKVKIVKMSGSNDIDFIRKKKGHSAVISQLRSARNLVVDDYFIYSKYKPYEKKYRKYTYQGNYFRK